VFMDITGRSIEEDEEEDERREVSIHG
jgi:hypothetical protein